MELKKEFNEYCSVVCKFVCLGIQIFVFKLN